jgi:hypothetical protein
MLLFTWLCSAVLAVAAMFLCWFYPDSPWAGMRNVFAAAATATVALIILPRTRYARPVAWPGFLL